jgi:hypothetical protein
LSKGLGSEKFDIPGELEFPILIRKTAAETVRPISEARHIGGYRFASAVSKSNMKITFATLALQLFKRCRSGYKHLKLHRLQLLDRLFCTLLRLLRLLASRIRKVRGEGILGALNAEAARQEILWSLRDAYFD